MSAVMRAVIGEQAARAAQASHKRGRIGDMAVVPVSDGIAGIAGIC